VVGFEHDGANFRLDTDELERFERLDGFTHTSAADGKFFGQLLFGGEAFAGLDLPFFNQVQNVIDNLGGDGLLANQAYILRATEEPGGSVIERIIASMYNRNRKMP
jgi:hypothetical protein